MTHKLHCTILLLPKLAVNLTARVKIVHTLRNMQSNQLGKTSFSSFGMIKDI